MKIVILMGNPNRKGSTNILDENFRKGGLMFSGAYYLHSNSDQILIMRTASLPGLVR